MADEADEARGFQAASSDRVANQLAHYILPTSGTMIGVCTTLVGLVKIMEGRTGPSRVDECGALIAVLFLASVILSYAAIRLSPTMPGPGRRCERVADALFLFGLICLVGLAMLFALEAV